MGEVKLVYLARRNPTLGADEFPARWRRHGELAMSLGNWAPTISGYAQCDNLGSPWGAEDAGSQDRWSLEHDGVGSVWFYDQDALERFVSHADFVQLLMDEWGAFDDQVAHTSVLVTEEVLKKRPGTAFKLAWFLSAADGVSSEEFTQRWRQHAVEIMRSHVLSTSILNYVHNHPVTPAASEEALAGTVSMGLHVSGIAEMGFASLADMRAFLGDRERKRLGGELGQILDPSRTVTVATNEVTMSNRLRAPGA
jgi:hypothetical protein